MLIDNFFNYKYVVRFILLNKILIKNTYHMPGFKKLKYFFNLAKLDDINDVQLYNYFYLIKFFFGRNSFFSKVKKFYLLGSWYYSFNVQLLVSNNYYIINILHLLYNNIIFNLDKSLLYFGFKDGKINIFSILIKDQNIYSELKTNLGLFHIKEPFRVNLYFLGNLKRHNLLLIKNLKYI